MKTLCVIPARSGSQGLKDKNIQKINGIPLLGRAVQQAIRCGCINDVVVSTDSEHYAEIAKQYGAKVPFIRPSSLAENETTMEATLQHALLSTEEKLASKYDICVFITCTDIFRKDEYLVNVVELLKSNSALDSAFVANVTYKNYWEQMPYGQFQRVRPYMQIYGQRQERLANRRLLWREDTGIASASKSSIWRSGRRIGDNVEIIEINDTLTSLDIHTEEDLKVAEFALNLRENLNSGN